MPECPAIEPLLTPYLDGELEAPERLRLEEHFDRCPPCRARAGAERSARELLRASKPLLQREHAPAALHARCASLCRTSAARSSVAPFAAPSRSSSAVRWLAARAAPLAMAAALILIVAGSFVYRFTATSPRLLAAELAADHVKCFAMNAVLRTQQTPGAVESALASGFDWNVHLPENAGAEGLELVGARPCLYGEGKVAHIMYRHNGRPVSLFMLPRSKRPEQLVQALGHEAAIWSVGDRTFVLVSREGRSEVERMAAFVHAAMQ